VCYRATLGELAIQSQIAALCTEAAIMPLHGIGPRIKEVHESQVRAMESTRSLVLRLLGGMQIFAETLRGKIIITLKVLRVIIREPC
jgi:hypothetical protein